VLEHAEVKDHDHADEDLEEQDELALRNQVGLAGLVDQLRDVEHRLVDGQVLQLREDRHAERESQDTHDQAGHQERAAVDAMEVDRAEIRKNEVGFAACVTCLLRRRWRTLHGLRLLRSPRTTQSSTTRPPETRTR
jgi:hypothetical protein